MSTQNQQTPNQQTQPRESHVERVLMQLMKAEEAFEEAFERGDNILASELGTEVTILRSHWARISLDTDNRSQAAGGRSPR